MRALLVLLAAPLLAAAGTPTTEPSAWLALSSGRARLLHGGDALELGHARAIESRAGGTLVVDCGARVTLSFPERASLSIVGPAELAFAPPAKPGASLRVGVERARELCVETRRGATRLELACGFEIDAGAGMFRLADRVDGGAELTNQGGVALRLASLERRPSGSWPARVAVGETAKLAPLSR
ncbi:MAG: hypothetical protein EPO68_10060 [Planctomycetota bacterium]|nr:MAG: hypothetical protein EPO68_10060 [Planctomycetota bacterium]